MYVGIRKSLSEATRFSRLFIGEWRKGNGLVFFTLRKDHFLLCNKVFQAEIMDF